MSLGIMFKRKEYVFWKPSQLVDALFLKYRGGGDEEERGVGRNVCILRIAELTLIQRVREHI